MEIYKPTVRYNKINICTHRGCRAWGATVSVILSNNVELEVSRRKKDHFLARVKECKRF